MPKTATELLRPCALLTAIVCAATTSVSQASNECRIQYRYTEGSGFAKTQHVKNVFLDAGESRDVHQGSMVSIKSQLNSSKQVEVQLANKTFRLDKGNIDPPYGPYLTHTILQRLSCEHADAADPIIGSPEQVVNSIPSPAVIIRQFRGVANNTKQLAQEHYGVTQDVMAKAHKKAGYKVNEVGEALQVAYGTGSTAVARSLKKAGYTAEQVANVLTNTYKHSSSQAVKILKAVGYQLSAVASAMRAAYRLSANKLARVFRAAGYTAKDVAIALRSSTYKLGSLAVARALEFARYGVIEIFHAVGKREALNLEKQSNFFRDLATETMKNKDELREFLELLGVHVNQGFDDAQMHLDGKKGNK